MSNEMYSLRVLAKGKIEDLSKGFSLNGVPFTIYVRHKGNSLASHYVGADMLVKCRLLCDREASDLPVTVGDWTPAMIAEISPNAISLNDFDVYWGTGETIKNI